MTKNRAPDLPRAAPLAVAHERILLGAIVLLCLGVRLWNVDWGLPDFFEEATPFTVAWRIWNWGHEGFAFNPHFFNYPALSFIVNFLGQVLHYVVGHLLGVYSNTRAFQEAYAHDPTPFVIVARVISIMFDAGTALLVFKIGRAVATTATGLLAAAFVAVNASLLLQSQYISVDTPLVFFCTLSLLYIHRFAGNPSWTNAAMAGIGIGLATATKYTGATLILPLIALIPFLRRTEFRKPRTVTTVLCSIGIAALVFAAINPYIFSSFGEFMQDFTFESRHMTTGHLGLGPSTSSAGFYFLHAIPNDFGIAAAIFAVLGIGVSSLRRNRSMLWLLVFPVLYLIILSTWKMYAGRYLLPAFPVLFVVAAFGMSNAWDILARRLRTEISPERVVPLTSMLVLMIGWNAPSILAHHHSFSRPDTRALARIWIQEHVPPGSAIASIPMGWDALRNGYRLMTIPFDPYAPERVAPFYDSRWYEDFDIVVGSEYDYGRYVQEPTRFRAFIAYYDSLRARSRLVYEVAPDGDQPGGSIWLFKPDRPREIQFSRDLFAKLDVVPESARVGAFLRGLSNILVGKKQLGKVEQLTRSLVMREGNDSDAHRMLAIVLYDVGKNAEALDEIRRVLADRPGDADLLAMQGDILLRSKKFDEAEASLSRARELKPSLEMIYTDLLTIYMARNDRRSAIDLLTGYLQTLPPQSNKARSVRSYIDGLKNGRVR